ncbi:ankycorbin [Exaiptasia diaphana]|uniref:Uncharacterized protein n=1 Tax=Exaiptasia diaphana TaxID=2652724 RepID=A0A913XHP6_EXADI|nr:ankycorbin [Exaiptasia diaphana]
MKKIKGRLVKRASQTQLNIDSNDEWSKYDERLFEYIQQDNLTKLKSTLLKKGISVVKLSPIGTTAVHFACEKQNPQCLEVLLNEQPDLSVLDKTGCHALSVAAKVGSLECMRQLLQYNSEIITLQDYHKKTALHYAAGKGHFECVQLLLENTDNLDIRDKVSLINILISMTYRRTLFGHVITAVSIS